MNSCFESRPSVIIRADAGSGIGFGHFVRSVALGCYLAEDFNVRVASRNPDTGILSEYQVNLLKESSLGAERLEGRTRDEFDPKFLEAIGKDDIVVLDNYYYSTEFQRKVRGRCRALVCIDDMHDRHFVADLVMTFCPLRRSDFSLEPYSEFRGGMEWSFLRAPFLLPRSVRRAVSCPRKIALAMGGADPFALTNKFVRLVRSIAPYTELFIIAGETVRTDFEENANTHVLRMVSAEDIRSIFDECDLGIFPASTICVEAFSRGLPVAAGYFIDNQEELYTYGTDHRWFAPLGDMLADAELLRPRIERIFSSTPVEPPDFDFGRQRDRIRELFLDLYNYNQPI